MAEKHAGGRPLKFTSVEELQTKIDIYFNECDPHWIEEYDWIKKRDSSGKLVKDEDGQDVYVEKLVRKKTNQIPYTITGLALALSTTRDLLIDYEDKEKFSDTIKDAKMRCHNYAELNLFGSNATGPIFNLKNNYNWRDKTEQENSGEQKIIVETRRRDNKDD